MASWRGWPRSSQHGWLPASSPTNWRVQLCGFYGGWITNDVVGAVQTRARHELVVSLHRYSMQVRGPMGRSLPKMTAYGAGNLGSTAKHSGGESDEYRVRPSGKERRA